MLDLMICLKYHKGACVWGLVKLSNAEQGSQILEGESHTKPIRLPESHKKHWAGDKIR